MAPGDVVFLTGRAAGRVGAAAASVTASVTDLDTYVLDVRDSAAVSRFADALRRRHGGVDIVFSNAAARLIPDTPWRELIEPFVDTNNLGTTRMLRAFAPILRPGVGVIRHAEQPAESCISDRHRRMSLDDLDATVLAHRRLDISEEAGATVVRGGEATEEGTVGPAR